MRAFPCIALAVALLSCNGTRTIPVDASGADAAVTPDGALPELACLARDEATCEADGRCVARRGVRPEAYCGSGGQLSPLEFATCDELFRRCGMMPAWATEKSTGRTLVLERACVPPTWEVSFTQRCPTTDGGVAVCGAPDELTGSVLVCLEGHADFTPNQTDHVFTIAGVLTLGDEQATGARELVSCGHAARVSIGIRDDRGKVWRIGYGVRPTEQGALLGPSFRSLVGTRVSALVRVHRGFGLAAGLVLSNDAGVLLAIEKGTWGAALKPDDVPGVRVQAGSPACERQTTCGWQIHERLEFVASDTLTLEPGRRGQLRIAGATYDAFHVSRLQWDQKRGITCTDLGGATVWAVWRAGVP